MKTILNRNNGQKIQKHIKNNIKKSKTLRKRQKATLYKS